MATYEQTRLTVAVNGLWLQEIGYLGAEGFTVQCLPQDGGGGVIPYPQQGTYRGYGPNGEQVDLTLQPFDSEGVFYWEVILDFLFETVSGSLSSGTDVLASNEFNSPFLLECGIIGGELQYCEGTTQIIPAKYQVPKMLEKKRMPLPADSLLRYAKAVHAANPAAAGLLAAINQLETAYNLKQAPSTRTAVTIQETKTAMQLLRKNLQEGIPNKSMIGVTMPRPQVRQGTPPPKMTIGKWKNGLLDLKVKREKFAGKKWLTLQVMPTPSMLEEGVNILITKFPMQVDVDDFEGVDYVDEGVVWMRSRWEGVDANGRWFGPWTPWKKYNLPKNPNK